MTNEVVFSGEPLWITLFVTNVSHGDFYVPKRFNSNNYVFETAHTLSTIHGDGWPATYGDFIRLKPLEVLIFRHCFFLIDEVVGQGTFSVHFYNNPAPEVERQLKASGVPFTIALDHSFGIMRVNPGKANKSS